jgi:hypothetical protein
MSHDLWGHIKREADEVAHCLVKAAFHQSLGHMWIEKRLVFIQNIELAKQDVSS